MRWKAIVAVHCDKALLFQKLNILCWSLSIGFCLLMVFGLHSDLSGLEPLTRTSRILYQTFSRLIWGCSVAYIIFACVTSNGG